jgi:RluA family pseudouridine synthase
MIRVEEHVVTDSTAGQKLMDFLAGHFPMLPSRSAAKKAIKRGEVLLDGNQCQPHFHLQPGQVVTLVDLEKSLPKPYELPLEVVYEDEYLAIINKPPGLPVSGNRYKTVVNALGYNLQPSKEADALKWARPVHRLDIPTQGLLMVAKTALTLMKLGKLLQDRKISKRYRAIVAGQVEPFGIIDETIDGLEAITRYQLVSCHRSVKTGFLSLLDLWPLTGRKHQLRIHLSGTGHPILGDSLHTADYPVLKGKGLFLCAVELKFDHPEGNREVHVTIDQPEKFDALLKREAERWKKYNT